MLNQKSNIASETQSQDLSQEFNIREVVARIQKEKSDITANGYRMGKHVETERRERVKALWSQTVLIERIGYTIFTVVVLTFIWGRITADGSKPSVTYFSVLKGSGSERHAEFCGARGIRTLD